MRLRSSSSRARSSLSHWARRERSAVLLGAHGEAEQGGEEEFAEFVQDRPLLEEGRAVKDAAGGPRGDRHGDGGEREPGAA